MDHFVCRQIYKISILSFQLFKLYVFTNNRTPAPSSTVPNPPPKPPLPKVPPKPKRASVKEVIVSFENIDDNDKENDETVSKNERFVQEMFDTFLDGYDGRVTEVAVVKTDEAIVTATNGSEDKVLLN